jgi:hypothetical protein
MEVLFILGQPDQRIRHSLKMPDNNVPFAKEMNFNKTAGHDHQMVILRKRVVRE